MFPCLAYRHLHFSKLNNICNFSDHLINLWIYKWHHAIVVYSHFPYFSSMFSVIGKFQYFACYPFFLIIDYRPIKKNKTGPNSPAAKGGDPKIFDIVFFLCWLFIFGVYILRSRVVWSCHPWAILNIQDGVQDGCGQANIRNFPQIQCLLPQICFDQEHMFGSVERCLRSIWCTVAMVTSDIAKV